MSLDTEKKEIGEIVNRLLDNMLATVSSRTDGLGALLKRQLGIMRAKYMFFLDDGTFPAQLQACFTAAENANVTLMSMSVIRQRLFDEKPQGQIAASVVMLAVTFCLSTESRMLTKVVYTSRDDVEKDIKRMKCAFDTARDMSADLMDSASYQAITFLAGALTNHLASTARPLPRMIVFRLPKSFPALTLAHRIYQDASRYDEIILENRVVHPLFCSREIIGLSK